MNEVARTLFIPLYGKAMVSRKGIILNDKKAEEIWTKNEFPLKRKSKSKWLAYFMSMRAVVFDNWTKDKIKDANTLVLHLGCGLDNRIGRVGHRDGVMWIDVDQEEVIRERRKYFDESDHYQMLAANVATSNWITRLPEAKHLVLVMEGLSMYLSPDELLNLLEALDRNIVPFQF